MQKQKQNKGEVKTEVNNIMTSQVNMWTEENKKDKVDFRQIIQLHHEKCKEDVEKEVFKVILMKENW